MIKLYQHAGPKSFEVFRAAVFGLWFLNLVLTPLDLLAQLPPAIYNPIGIPLKFLHALSPIMLNPMFLVFFKWTGTGIVLLAAAGIFPRASSLIGSVLITLEQALLRGFGYVNHAELPLLYAAYIITMAYFLIPKSGGVSESAKVGPTQTLKPYQIPFVLFLMIFLFTYTLIGIHRIAFGGLEIFTTERITYWIAVNTYDVSYYRFGWGQQVLESPLLKGFFVMGFPVITVFEILAPFALIHPLFRAVFLLIIYPFHLMNLIFMDLLFLESMLLLILLFDISRWLEPKREGSPSVIFYDGVCGLCDRFVQWTLQRDTGAVFAFAPLQGQTASITQGLRPGNPLEWTIIFYDAKHQKHYKRSAAVVRILIALGGLWRIAGVFLWLAPLSLRDLGYRWVAANRYRWFGKFEVCHLPAVRHAGRFLP